MQGKATALCVAHVQSGCGRPKALSAELWQRALVSLAQCCFAQQRWDDVLLVADQLLDGGTEVARGVVEQLLAGLDLLRDVQAQQVLARIFLCLSMCC
jgi:hypothetical protein